MLGRTCSLSHIQVVHIICSQELIFPSLIPEVSFCYRVFEKFSVHHSSCFQCIKNSKQFWSAFLSFVSPYFTLPANRMLYIFLQQAFRYIFRESVKFLRWPVSKVSFGVAHLLRNIVSSFMHVWRTNILLDIFWLTVKIPNLANCSLNM